MSDTLEPHLGLLPEPKSQWLASIAGSLSMHGMVCDSGSEVRLPAIPSWMKREDQSQMNSCAGNAGTTCAEKNLYAATGKSIQLSRWFAYIEGCRSCGLFPGDSGCYLSGIVDSLRKKGCPPEEMVPYPGRYDIRKTNFSSDIYEEAAKIQVIRTVSLDGGYSDWRKILGQNTGAVLLGINWPIRTTTKNGHKYASRYQPAGRGGHAIAAVFLADSTDSEGNPDVWIMNSHRGDEIYLVSATFIREVQQADPFGNIGITDLSVPVSRVVNWSSDTEMMA